MVPGHVIAGPLVTLSTALGLPPFFTMATPTSASTSTQPAPSSKPLVATGDWTKNLVHLAKTAELKYELNTSIEPPGTIIGYLFL